MDAAGGRVDAFVDDPVIDGGGASDAPVSTPDAPVGTPDARQLPDAMGTPDADDCPGACTSCLGDGTCVITCGNGECNGGVTCPPDRACQVDCIGDTACETGFVDCTAATSCEIQCLGSDACDNGVTCGGSSCTIQCEGSAACEDGLVSCEAASCDVTCNGSSACDTGVCCDGGDCDGDCSNMSGGNCSCPAG